MNKNDIKFGLEKENQYLEILKKTFDMNLEKIEFKYSIFDFCSKDTYVELKSRNIAKDKYSDTMIGFNKLKRASKVSLPVYFVICFTDGLYYWKYKEGEFEVRDGGRIDRGRPEIKKYAYIKTDNLIKIE